MNEKIIETISKIEKAELTKVKGLGKVWFNEEKKLYLKVCESSSTQTWDTCWQDMSLELERYICDKDYTFVYYFVWKSRTYYRAVLNNTTFDRVNSYISPNRGKYIFYMDTLGADNGEPIINVSSDRKGCRIGENLLFTLTKVDISIDIIDPIKNERGEGFIYMISNKAFKDGVVKIGKSIHWEKRMEELYNTSVPYPFSPICVIKVPNMDKAEKYFHKQASNWVSESRLCGAREFWDLGENIEKMKQTMIDYMESVGGENIVFGKEQNLAQTL